ncbi:hypothetical protein BCL57_001649 [Agromyces flavus]|uniref:DUF7882 domain-containing protein n=1 Tax=Agromyces flavus TaxID=589382 RepID=A0A1H1LB52_9MICO|nr:hypothetical protein [Agromyces flavus]MCP2367495.1 hypothetical protein [Agromyces flavus]GGI45617.1 hypothetical protein GCM10010932_10450 [Agromyces flavus]SDR71552.1 hypothetical protein SAMN04489721_0060 [Agromyces flavus]
MGSLNLDGVVPIMLDDDLLDHVFTVITTKLRRKEPVLLSWSDECGQEQRVFLTPITFIRAEFDSTVRAPRDRHLLDRLMIAVNSNSGLSLDAAVADRLTDHIPTGSFSLYHHDIEEPSGASTA